MNAMPGPKANHGRGPCSADPAATCAFVPAGTFRDESGKVGEVSLLRCMRCGVGISHPPLPDVSFLYDGRESQDFQPRTNRIATWIKKLAFRRQAKVLLDQIDAQPSRVLDFGCGSGLFTRCFGDLLPGVTVTGSDFHAEPPVPLADRSYVPMDQLPGMEGFDLVIAMHVLEHDDDVLGLLAKIASAARQGGSIVIEVPNIDCVWVALFGRAWDAWYLPFHRTHFNRAALRALVERIGLTIVAEHAITVPTMGRSVSNLVDGNKGFLFLLIGIVLHPLQWAGERLTKRPTALRIIARR